MASLGRGTPSKDSVEKSQHPQWRAVQPGDKIVDGISIENSVGVFSDKPNVRRCHHVAQSPKRMITWQRLIIEHVNCKTCDALGFQRRDQSFFIDKRTSRRIHEPCCWLHQCQLVLTNYALRPLRQDKMQRYPVGPAKKCLFLNPPDTGSLCRLIRQILAPGER